MLVENPALLLPSASCFCQSGLTTLILTSEALSSSFIWQKPDVAKTDAERWRGGRHLQRDRVFCPKVLAVATGNSATRWSSGALNCPGFFTISGQICTYGRTLTRTLSIWNLTAMFLIDDMNADAQKSSQKYEAFVAFLTGGNQLLRQKGKCTSARNKQANQTSSFWC